MIRASRALALLVAGLLSLFVGILTVASAPPASADTEWTPQTSGTSANLQDIEFGDKASGVAVGPTGTVLTTKDGGATWTHRDTGSTQSFFAAMIAPGFCGSMATPADCVWVAGTAGTILFSADGGATWCAQQTGTTETLLGLESLGPNDIIAVGTNGTILRSGSGGTTGNKCGAAGAYDKVTSGTTKTLYDVDASGSGVNGYVSGDDGTILEITLAAPTGQEANINKVAPVASGTTADLFGIAVLGGDPDPSANNPSTIWVVGENGTIRRGTDAIGLTNPTTSTFVAQSSGTTQTLRDVEMDLNTTTNLFAVGDVGTIIGTNDGGTTWGKGIAPTCQSLLAATVGYGPTDVQYWAAGERGTIITNLAMTGATPPNCAQAQTGSNGYRMVATDGGIFTFGSRTFHGSTGNLTLNKPIVGGATDVSDYDGYWIVASDGGVFTFDAPFFGSLGGQVLTSPAVEIEPTPTGKGYWIVLANGKVYPFGDAQHFGDMSGKPLTQPIIGMSVSITGKGYWLVGQDGGIFTFGDAGFFGSTGAMKLNAPVIDLAPTPDNQGYYLVAKDGGVFTFGSAQFKGSTGNMKLNAPVIAMLVNPTGTGYWLAATDGGIFTFGTIPFLGSMGGTKLNAPILDLIN
jgi:photosystem II stability/assembly factor-like uncharacterized protein